jgi:hypothetical protein
VGGIPCPRPTLWPAGYLTTSGRAILEAVPRPAPAGRPPEVTGPTVCRVRGGLRELAAAGMVTGESGRLSACLAQAGIQE